MSILSGLKWIPGHGSRERMGHKPRLLEPRTRLLAELLAEKDKCVPRQDIQHNARAPRPRRLPPFLPMISSPVPRAFPGISSRGPPLTHTQPTPATIGDTPGTPPQASAQSFRGPSDPSPLQGYSTPPPHHPPLHPRESQAASPRLPTPTNFRPEPQPASSLSPSGRGLPHLPGLRPP